MAYDYSEMRPKLFTDDGQRLFLQIRDRVGRLTKTAGAVRLQEAISGSSGDNWEMVACIDRMVELGELYEVTKPGSVQQYRVFVPALTRH